MSFRILVTDDLSGEAIALLDAHEEITFDVAKRNATSPGDFERALHYD